MAIELRLSGRRLFPHLLFRSLGQFAFWLAIIAALAAIASIFLHGGQLKATVFGGAVGSSLVWLPMLPYELRIHSPDTGECLKRICVYLTKSNFMRAGGSESDGLGTGIWTPNLPWWRRYKGNEVEVSADGSVVSVRGPSSMIKPLWRNFRGPWREVHDPI